MSTGAGKEEIWGQAGSGSCPVDDIATALIDESGNPTGDLAVLYGYLWRAAGGAGPRAHLYLTRLLDEYVELETEHILYWRKVPFDGGTLVWVRRDATLRRVTHRARSESAHEVFLAGQIADAYGSAAPVDAGGWQAGPLLETATCASRTCH